MARFEEQLASLRECERPASVLRIDPRPDGAALMVSAHRLAGAIAEATQLLRQEVSR